MVWQFCGCWLLVSVVLWLVDLCVYVCVFAKHSTRHLTLWREDSELILHLCTIITLAIPTNTF